MNKEEYKKIIKFINSINTFQVKIISDEEYSSRGHLGVEHENISIKCQYKSTGLGYSWEVYLNSTPLILSWWQCKKIVSKITYICDKRKEAERKAKECLEIEKVSEMIERLGERLPENSEGQLSIHRDN